MRKLILISLSALMVFSFSGIVLATNPHQNNCDVGVDVNIPHVTELYSTVGTNQDRHSASNPIIEVTNAYGKIPSSGRTSDTINYLTNGTSIEVSVELDLTIPNFSRFHVIVNPSNPSAYNMVTSTMPGGGGVQVNADKVITWDKRGGSSWGGSNTLNSPVVAFTGSSSTLPSTVDVHYAVDAIHGLPSQGTTSTSVTWTISNAVAS